MRTTVGQLLVNSALPEDMRDYQRRLSKSEAQALLERIADDPEQYKSTIKKLFDVGAKVSHRDGMSMSMRDLTPSRVKTELLRKFEAAKEEILADKSLSRDARNDKLVQIMLKLQPILGKQVYETALKDKNKLAQFADAGVRGGPSQVQQMLGAPVVVTDNKGRPIPFAITSSFAEGLSPAEYWATTYGVRKGYSDLKASTPKAGYFSKQLANAAHRLVVGRGRPMQGTGLPVDADDPDNEGAVLAKDVGPYKEGTVLTPKILKDIKKRAKRILVHSPVSAIAPSGSLPQWAVGIRDKGSMHPYGENVGMPAAQSIAEPLAQASISSKHTAGVVGASGKGGSSGSGSGFDQVERLANIPKHFPGGATLAERDGVITGIEKAPQGGYYVQIGDTNHYVDVDSELSVKVGDKLEAGDALSDGVPNPADVVRLKGIGEGRRYMVKTMSDTLRKAGVRPNRRNVEILSRGLINHVVLDDTVYPGSMPGDIVAYDDLAARYVPRKEAGVFDLKKAQNQFLEAPVLHYSIGTRVTPSVQKELKEFGVNDVLVHAEPPKFTPRMLRVADSMASDEDWQVRLGGTGLKKNFLKSVHEGATSSTHGTSYIPSLAKGTEFGRGDGKWPY